jgi:hypothetical protein
LSGSVLEMNIFKTQREDLMRQMFKTVSVMAALLGCTIWLTGCTQIFSSKKSAEKRPGPVVTTPVSAPAPESRRTNAVYYDFEDVLIPVELTVVQDKSMIVSTPGFTSGILMLRGRVERRSLINFFNNNMRRDNWGMVSQISSPNMAILVFEKPMKSGVISIKSEQIYTYVEIGVAPRINQGPLSEEMGDLFQSDLTQ